jgi:hypothetical protein
VVFVYFNSPQPAAPTHGARGSLRAVLRQEAGAGITEHMAVPELPRALVAGAGATTHTRSQSWPVPGAGAAAMEHMVVLELPRTMVVGAGATRHMAAPELPCARI